MANVGDLINSTYRHLSGTMRQEINLLSNIVAPADTTIQFTYTTNNLSTGDYLSIDDEILYVWEVDSGAKTATVQRGMAGTTAAVHSGSLVERNARFPKFYVRAALKDEIVSWGERVYSVDTIPVSINQGTRSVRLNQLSDDFLFGLELVRTPPTGTDAARPVTQWTVQRGTPMTSYVNGVSLVLTGTACDTWTGTFSYARPFNVEVFTDDTNLETIIGLPPEFQDIPPMGAVARLMMGRDILRTYTEAQGEPRDAAEVSVGQMSQIAMRYRAMADTRLSQAASRLLGKYGWRKI